MAKIEVSGEIELSEYDVKKKLETAKKYYLSDEQGIPLGIYGVQYDVTQDILAKQQHEQEIQYLLEHEENVYSTHLIDVNEWRIIQEKRKDHPVSIETR